MAKGGLNETITEQLMEFDAPHFAEGPKGTLHGGPYDVDGYRFFHFQLVGGLEVKTAKGCTLHFLGKNGEFTRMSESRDIETKFSKTLQKGMTQFDIALDKEETNALRSCEKIRIVFPKLFGKTECEFTVNNHKYLQQILK